MEGKGGPDEKQQAHPMRLVHLSLFWTLALDCIAWAIIQPSVAYLAIKVPPPLLDHRRWLYRMRGWEKEGTIYQDLFHVKAWKSRLPDAGLVFRDTFSKKQILSSDPQYIQRWVQESCRAELCHWAAMLPALLFLLWNPPHLAIAMLIYAILFNAPLIIVQRHNRPRLLTLLDLLKRRRGRREASPPPPHFPGH